MLVCKPAILENMISSLLQYSTYVATFIYSPIRLLLFICLSLATKNVFFKNCKLLRMNMIMRHRKYMNMKNVWGWSFFFDVLVIYDICINTKNKPPVRIELTTPGLQDQCSNHWAMEALYEISKCIYPYKSCKPG